MISAINSNTSFTGVVPVRVFIDGMETFDKKYIKSACRQINNALSGATKRKDISDTFARYDADYKAHYAQIGYPKYPDGKTPQPSDYFRCVDGGEQMYIFTGPQALSLRESGKNIGKNKKECKIRNLNNSFDLHEAKCIYTNIIAKYINNVKLRLTESFDKITKIKAGKPVTLQINMKSNGKYGLTTFKMGLDNIEFKA